MPYTPFEIKFHTFFLHNWNGFPEAMLIHIYQLIAESVPADSMFPAHSGNSFHQVPSVHMQTHPNGLFSLHILPTCAKYHHSIPTQVEI